MIRRQSTGRFGVSPEGDLANRAPTGRLSVQAAPGDGKTHDEQEVHHRAPSPRPRRGWDSNPRYRCRYTSFPGWPIQPLLHPSGFRRTRNAIPLPAASAAELWFRFRIAPGQSGLAPLANSLLGPLQKCCWIRCRTVVDERSDFANWPSFGCCLTPLRGAGAMRGARSRPARRGAPRVPVGGPAVLAGAPGRRSEPRGRLGGGLRPQPVAGSGGAWRGSPRWPRRGCRGCHR